MTDLVTIQTDNYANMAKAMGLSTGLPNQPKKVNNLNRLRIWHSPIKGQREVAGKMMNIEVVEGGCYRLEILKDDTSEYVYSTTATIRPFMQRFMYRRYVSYPNPKPGESKGEFHRTIMSDTLAIDLKDNQGKFNCGKPTGYVEDFKSLPNETQELIRQIKRVRVIFGTIDLDNPINDKGETVEVKSSIPFIWEIDNKTAYKILGDIFDQYSKKQILPLQHNVTLDKLIENPLPNGSSFFTPSASINFKKTNPVISKDNETFTSFLDWIKNYNDYIYKEWDAKTNARQNVISSEDKNTVDEFVDVEIDTE